MALAFIGIIPFTFNFLVARSFGKEILGAINISISFCLIISIFVTNFFGSSGNKYLAEYRGSNSLKPFLFILKIMFYGPIITLSIITIAISLNWDFFTENFSLDRDLLASVILYIFFRSFYILLRKVFYGIDLVKSYVINEIISDIFMLIAIIYVSYTQQVSFLIECYIISYLLFTFLSIITLFKKLSIIAKPMNSNNNFNPQNVLKNFFGYGIISMIGTVASTGTGYLSIIIIGSYLSTSDAGLYSSALSIISILMFVPKLFTQVFLPEFSKLFGEGNKQKIFHILFQANWLMILIASILCLSVFLFSDILLSLFGAEFIRASIVLKIMIPSVLIRIISIPFVSFLSGTKYVIYPNIGGLIIFFISILSWIFLVPEYQLIGIAIGYTFGIIIGIGYQIIVAIMKIRSFKFSN